MSTPLVFQTIAFQFPAGEGNDPDIAIQADSGITSAYSVSTGNDAIEELKQLNNLVSGVKTYAFSRELTFLVTAANAASIVAGMPALITRMATAAPQVTSIVTWGIQASFN